MTLWTPGGEYPVGGKEPESGAAEGPSLGRGGPDEDPLAGLSEEDRTRLEEAAAEMAEVRQQLASIPAEVVVSNHLMGLYELAAIHLSQEPPAFEPARLAIDALGAVVEGLAGRLGEAEPTLKDALGQIRLAFVQVKSSQGAPDQ
ncbi:MAG: hypothetical protein ACRD0U_12505 [Acidimicrobiales bacterium]